LLLAIAAIAGPALAEAASLSHVERWDVPGVSSDLWESHPALDPSSGDLWFVRSDKRFAGWRLMVAPCTQRHWAPARAAPIAAPGLEADPYFTADGATLYFISSRATGAMKSAGLDIWTAQRNAKGRWSAPQRLPEPVNSNAAEWFPRPAADGWLYFGSHRDGGLGDDDIWRARRGGDGRWQVENAGPAINTAGAEYEFQPSPDGTWALLAADGGIFRVEHGADGWLPRQKLEAQINKTGSEIGPMLAPDRDGFVFSRDAGDGRSGELYLARSGSDPSWTASCGPLR
jgi:hypothetical protein